MISRPFPLYKIVEGHAFSQPDAIAVVFGQASLTYAELNRKANRLAHGLLAQNIAPGDTVAVLVGPSADILVALLAIHKLGAIYVPVDPGFPVARINAILEEVSPVILLWEQQTELVDEAFRKSARTISEMSEPITTEDNLNFLPCLDSVSHIYFTSGTTGRPKGVLSTHDNLLHYISTAIHRYGFKQDDRFIAVARFTFSISMFELMVPLTAGGQVRILPRDNVLNLNLLCKAVESSTVFHFGPSLLRQFLHFIKTNYESFDCFDGLRHVSSGGDMVPPQVLEDLKAIFRNAEVFVIYGASEISCMGCTYQVPRDRRISRTLVGTAHQDMKVKIVDDQGNKVGVDVPGQIYFSGRGLAKGYLNLPELTQEKFVLMDGERHYAIGDTGRYDHSGNIELLGRQDFQVQIRGMRVELLEVESRLKNHPAIADCVVVGRSIQGNDEKSLVGYVVLNQSESITAASLRKFVGEYLPDYMVPSIFVKLERLPTNHNAKLDRNQLPVPHMGNMLLSSQLADASNEVERTLVRLWQELFSVENIGIDHDFFELGGDSLLAVKLLIAIEEEFDLFVPISSMITAPTIRAIARIIQSDAKTEGIGDVVVLKKGNTEPPLFCLYGVLLYKDLANCLATPRMVCGVYLQEELALMHKGPDSAEFDVFANVENIANRYLESIRSFQPKGPYFLCGESFGGIIALEVARKLQQEGQNVSCLAMFDTIAPGHLASLSQRRRLSLHLQSCRKNGLGYIKERLSKYSQSLGLWRRFKADQSKLPADNRHAAREIASKNYKSRYYPDEVTLFRATDRSEFDPGVQDLGWLKVLPRLEVHDIQGDHLGILKRGRVEAIASVLDEKLKTNQTKS